MKLSYSNFYIKKQRTGEILTNAPDGKEKNLVGTGFEADALHTIHVLRTNYYSEANKMNCVKDFITKLESVYGGTQESEADIAILDEKEKEALRENVSQRLINFFSEFDFEPAYRFVNSLSLADDKREYVRDYFELSGNPYVNSIAEKMKSIEFDGIIQDLDKLNTQTHINKRFKLYYGSAGTGKTTRAMKEAEGNCMVCHSGIQPQDLMEDFTFVDGEPTFQKGALRRAMDEGKKIVLDEINLLPFESVRFLQTILDNKEEFNYKGETIHIADGFQIIGTMNLIVNGASFVLTDALVDRANDLKKFKLTAADLASALI